MPDTAAPVVVGVDGTQDAIRAACWAGALAVRLSSPLHIVHAKPYPGHSLTDVVANVRAIQMTEQHALAESILRAAEAAVRAACPDLTITTEQSHDTVDAALVDSSRRARAIVVGSDRVSAGAALLVGSSTLTVAAHSSCPVVAWRGEVDAPNDQPIVLGVNTDRDSRVAIATAFELADRLDIEIVAVHAWSTRRAPGDINLPFMIDWQAVEDDERSQLSHILQPWMDRYPDIKVTYVLEAKKPSQALLARTGGAQLVVVGSRGRALLSAAVLGSTGLNLLHHSEIPVVICRPHDDSK